MAISKEFLNLFNRFVANYKQNGTPSFYTWAKEQNYSLISSCFDELIDIITENQETIHDVSIIENLSITILLSAKTNPYLLTCWIDFLNQYNIASKQYVPIGTIDISIGPSGAPSENLIRDLKDALLTQQKASEATKKVHLSETEQLRKQIYDLQTENGQLKLQNDQLKIQVNDHSILEALQPKIQIAQEQLTSFSQLFSTLHEITKQKPVTEIPTPQITLPSLTAEKIESKDNYLLTSHIIEENNTTEKNQPPMPPPPPPVTLLVPPLNKSSVRVSSKDTKTESKGTSAKQSFFTPPSNVQLLDGINSALEKMKKQKETRKNTGQVDGNEKKKLPLDESKMPQLN